MVDSGATHNFIATREATRLGFKLSNDDKKLKVMKSTQAQGTQFGQGCGTDSAGWKGTVNILSISLDGFNLILGNELFVMAKAVLLPHLNGC